MGSNLYGGRCQALHFRTARGMPKAGASVTADRLGLVARHGRDACRTHEVWPRLRPPQSWRKPYRCRCAAVRRTADCDSVRSSPHSGDPRRVKPVGIGPIALVALEGADRNDDWGVGAEGPAGKLDFGGLDGFPLCIGDMVTLDGNGRGPKLNAGALCAQYARWQSANMY
jgi:hypothetical protein